MYVSTGTLPMHSKDIKNYEGAPKGPDASTITHISTLPEEPLTMVAVRPVPTALAMPPCGQGPSSHGSQLASR